MHVWNGVVHSTVNAGKAHEIRLSALFSAALTDVNMWTIVLG